MINLTLLFQFCSTRAEIMNVYNELLHSENLISQNLDSSNLLIYQTKMHFALVYFTVI